MAFSRFCIKVPLAGLVLPASAARPMLWPSAPGCIFCVPWSAGFALPVFVLVCANAQVPAIKENAPIIAAIRFMIVSGSGSISSAAFVQAGQHAPCPLLQATTRCWRAAKTT
jgi:hypothetical protein